jgi:hypothetical protein
MVCQLPNRFGSPRHLHPIQDASLQCRRKRTGLLSGVWFWREPARTLSAEKAVIRPQLPVMSKVDRSEQLGSSRFLKCEGECLFGPWNCPAARVPTPPLTERLESMNFSLRRDRRMTRRFFANYRRIGGCTPGKSCYVRTRSSSNVWSSCCTPCRLTSPMINSHSCGSGCAAFFLSNCPRRSSRRSTTARASRTCSPP